jgi:hypothetical protein
MEENQVAEVVDLGPGLSKVRRRRWFMWSAILAYMPIMVATLKISKSFNITAMVFAAWFAVLFVVTLLLAIVRCPRCGNYFHMHGMTLLFFRKCLHCQLHINADK